MLRFSRISNLSKQQPTESKKDSYEGVTTWGFDYGYTKKGYYYSGNDFPQQLLQDVYNSPVAAACIELWVEFVSGMGFVNDQLNSKKVNSSGETGLQLLNKIAYDVSHLEGFCVHVGYNLEGKATELHHQPFEQTRLGEIKGGTVQDIKTNPYFGIPKEYDRKYTKTFYTFDPTPSKVQAQMQEHARLKREGKVKYDYPGQMFWVSIEKPLARIYPQPFYYSGYNWFKVDAEIQKFHERNLQNNLILSHILNVYGDPDEPLNKDNEDGDQTITRGEAFDRELNATARGAENGGVQLINWYTAEEQKLIPEKFPTNANDQLYQTLQDVTTNQIGIACRTPTVLIGIQEAGKLGNTQEIINSIRIMQARVKPKQHFISDNVKKLFAVLGVMDDCEIEDTNLINVLPDGVLEGDTLTTQEKRNYLSKNFNVDLSLSTSDGGEVKIESEE